jgi:hypothetical protein
MFIGPNTELTAKTLAGRLHMRGAGHRQAETAYRTF